MRYDDTTKIEEIQGGSLCKRNNLGAISVKTCLSPPGGSTAQHLQPVFAILRPPIPGLQNTFIFQQQTKATGSF